MDTGSVGQRRVFADYGDLRAYSGSASVIEISSPGIEGSFVRDRNDVNTRDNGATIIVGNNGSRWKRQYKGAADARWFGARGNNVADDALALQACLDAGLDLFLKEGLTFYSSSPLRFSADSQRMSGGGTLRTNGEIAISAVSLRGVSVTGLKIVCANSASCVGILFSRVAKSTIAYCTISRHGDAGVKLVDGCSENQILSNTFYVAASNPKFGLPSASDINIWGVATRNVIRENKCLAKGGYGIQINSHYVDAKSQGNVVDGNLIDDYNSYGIMLYRNGPYVPGDKQGVLGTLVTGNVVRNISGARPADPGNPLVRSFGAGIYIQGAEETLVRNNRISDCNGATNSLLLAPGAIGVGSVGGIIIEGNIISDSAQTGIYINDSNSLGVKDAEIMYGAMLLVAADLRPSR